MNNEKNELIEQIHSSGWKSVWAVTGGGIAAVHVILAYPGASRFILDIRIPYSREALAAYLGEPPVYACSEETARKMAAKALEKGTLGVSCTAVLQSGSHPIEPHRAFICIQSSQKIFCERIDLEPGTRSEQDAFLSGVLLSKLAKFGSSSD